MAFEKLEKEKQNRIINAACKVFARHGYQKASMADIAEAAGVSKSVLFKYFSTKQNLYQKVFRLSSDSIRAADASARAAVPQDADIFTLMRQTAKTRLTLFQETPWIYQFSYAAAFDTDPYVRDLRDKEIELYRQSADHPPSAPNPAGLMRGLREDISPSTARQILFWISQGYLEDKLYQGDIDPDALEQGFQSWIDILELLLKNKNPERTARQVNNE